MLVDCHEGPAQALFTVQDPLGGEGEAALALCGNLALKRPDPYSTRSVGGRVGGWGYSR